MQFAKRRLTFVALAIASGLAVQYPALAQDSGNGAASTSSSSTPIVTGQLPNFTALVKKVAPAVVNISTTRQESASQMGADQLPDIFRQFFGDQLPPGFRTFPGPGRGGSQSAPHAELRSLGSGFIISDDGYILTNAHVVAGADTIRVRLNDRRDVKAKLIGMDKKTDVALVKIELNQLPTIVTGNSDKLETGEWVAAIGSPFGFDHSVTQGIVSAINRTLPDDSYVPFIQTDVPINPGNSGGPLLNLQGQVVGINSQIYTQSGGYMGLSFAVPINVAMDVANQLKKDGHVHRGYLGVTIQKVSPALASSFGLKDARGALVSQISKDSPGAKGGLQPGDIVLSVNDDNIESPDDLPRKVGAVAPGNTVKLGILRNGKNQTLSLKVGDWPESTATAGKKDHENNRQPSLGVVVAPISSTDLKQAGLPHGVLIQQVAPNGVADNAGMQAGDVIIDVNQQPVTSVDELRSIISKLPQHKPVAFRMARGDQQMFVALRMDGKVDDGDDE